MGYGLIATWVPFEALIGRAEGPFEKNSHRAAGNSEPTTTVILEHSPGTAEIQILLGPPLEKGDIGGFLQTVAPPTVFSHGFKGRQTIIFPCPACLPA